MNKELEKEFGEGSEYLIAEEHLHDIGLFINTHYVTCKDVESLKMEDRELHGKSRNLREYISGSKMMDGWME